MNQQKKILIVEDEKQILSVLTKKLEREGFNVISARNGENGLKMALEEKPDLLLLDIVLPVMDGITVLEKLRQEKEGKDLLVIILTNLESAEKLEESKEKGARDYLVKTDWSLDDVVKKIKKTLNER